MQRVRAVFLDLDGAPLAPVLKAGLDPHVVVESSPGKFHIYWLTDDCPLDQFERVQRALARRFGGDPSVHDLPRVLRVPGFLHRKNEPFLVHTLEGIGTTAPPYALAEIVAALKLELDAPEQAKQRAALHATGKIGEGDRHAHLFRMGRSMARKGLSREAVAAALAAENATRCDPPLPPADVEYLAGRAFTAKDSQGWQDAPPRDDRGADDSTPLLGAGNATEGQEWPEPQPLPDGLARVDSFDLDMLPGRLCAWIGDIADRVQCPPDFVAVAAVAALGAVLGRKLAIRPQARTDWSEVANQWGLIIGRPGVLKSPAIEQALAPLRRLEATARERFAEEETTYRADALASKLRAKANERDAEKLLAKDRNADVSRYLRGDDDQGDAPTCKRYSTSDTSQESLAELVRQNQNGLLVHRDEMVSLLRDLDREEKAGARGFYLTGWNGTTHYTVDRIGRGFDLHIPAVCLSLLGSTQPGRIADYSHAATHGGRGDDGLIQRFGLMVWPDVAGEWNNIDRWPDTAAKNEAFGAFARLDELDPAAVGAEHDTGIDGEPEGLPFLRFDAEALGLFVEWRTDLERRLRSDELTPALVSHLNKYRKLAPSLALLFHLADGNSGPVEQSALLRALAWSEYLESHARRVYASGPASEAATASAILGRMRRRDLPAVFAGWEVWRPGWAGLADRATVADGLNLLVDFGYLRCSRIETSGRTATRYTVNPRALQ